MRAFVGVPLPPEIAAALAREGERMDVAGVRWIPAANLHITVKFLGDVEEATLAGFVEDVRGRIAGTGAVDLEIAGLGVFPERGPIVRIVWAGVRGKIDRLAGIAAVVEQAAEGIGVEREHRPYTAHITIGRAKDPRKAARAREAAAKRAAVSFGAFTAGEIVVYRSDLGPEGAVYTPVSTIAL